MRFSPPNLSLFLNPFHWMFGAAFLSSDPAAAALSSRRSRATRPRTGMLVEHVGRSVFVPSTGRSKPLKMVVMLHGAGQDAGDFATGTMMNEVAARHGFVVVYPQQSTHANAYGCWNWFDPSHQGRDQGDPARLAALTVQVATEQGVAPGCIYVAGMSAGGAMACLLGELFPELYSGVGVHSGLASFSAKDLSTALSSMRGGQRAATVPSRVPTIVFHGARDTTVAPINGMHVMDAAFGSDCRVRCTEQIMQDGTRVTRRRYFPDASRSARGEHWSLHDAAHTWSGGSVAGSFTTSQGPSASEEMLRFFESQSARRSARLSNAAWSV